VNLNLVIGQMLANAIHNACTFTQRGKIVLHLAPLQLSMSGCDRPYLLFEVVFTGQAKGYEHPRFHPSSSMLQMGVESALLHGIDGLEADGLGGSAGIITG
jgi:hypothetical protein